MALQPLREVTAGADSDARQGRRALPRREAVGKREGGCQPVIVGQERAARGPWAGQHEPVLLDDGRILLFDNLGADGRARLVETDPLTGEILWEYRGPEGRLLYSPEAGSCQRLPNGNTLISESVSGRAFEITRDGEIVWEFVSPHRAGENREFIATLFDVVRLEPEVADFVSPGRRS